MGTEERDRRRGEEPDVEAHYGKKRANEEPKTEAEDKVEDEAPDVEAHNWKKR